MTYAQISLQETVASHADVFPSRVFPAGRQSICASLSEVNVIIHEVGFNFQLHWYISRHFIPIYRNTATYIGPSLTLPTLSAVSLLH